MADAGCILQSLTDYIAPHYHIMPLDLGAKGRQVSLPPDLSSAVLTTQQLAVRSVAMLRLTLVASAFCVTVHCMVLYLDWKSSYLMAQFLTSLQLCGRITQVRVVLYVYHVLYLI